MRLFQEPTATALLFLFFAQTLDRATCDTHLNQALRGGVKNTIDDFEERREAGSDSSKVQTRQLKNKTKCFSLYSEMEFNNLVQTFPNNPDSHAYGYASFNLCTDGDMTSTANVYGGKTQLIACHIHNATDGDGMNGSGPPVINFCGRNGSGMINTGVPYLSPCMPYNDNDSSINTDVDGNKISSDSTAELVMQIGTHPKWFYFNCHSIASWTYWQSYGNGDAVGMCRGVMKSSTD